MIFLRIGLKNMNELVLCKEIYSMHCIFSAINAYSKLADLTVSEKEMYWVINFKNCKFDSAVTIHEFENYIIALSFMEMKNACG